MIDQECVGTLEQPPCLAHRLACAYALGLGRQAASVVGSVGERIEGHPERRCQPRNGRETWIRTRATFNPRNCVRRDPGGPRQA